MSVVVDHEQAKKILKKAIEEVSKKNWFPSSTFSNEIENVILGTHLTYRYILTTALLSKSTNEQCNPLTLQAGSDLKGAYDARSLCHKVLVPLERSLLGGRLGNSNEPFLNKPARYKELSFTNAVRRGNDEHLLENMIVILTEIRSSFVSFECLCDCIYYIFKRESRDLFDHVSSVGSQRQQSSLINFAQHLISQSFEGETCALLVGLTYSILGFDQSKDFHVQVHKVNQAGTSSNEVLDVDVYFKRCLIYTIEVKDKCFTTEDVQHAVNKAHQAGSKSLVFAVGPRGKLQESSYIELSDYWRNNGMNLYFVNVIDHFISVLSCALNININDVLSVINAHAKASSVKDDTFKHLLSSAKMLTL